MSEFNGLKPGQIVRLKDDTHYIDLVVSRLGRPDYDGNQVEVAYWSFSDGGQRTLVTKWIGADALEPLRS
jgi:hypothetical protein